MNASPFSNASIMAMQLLVPSALLYATSGTFGLTDLCAFCHLRGIVFEGQWEGGYAC